MVCKIIQRDWLILCIFLSPQNVRSIWLQFLSACTALLPTVSPVKTNRTSFACCAIRWWWYHPRAQLLACLQVLLRLVFVSQLQLMFAQTCCISVFCCPKQIVCCPPAHSPWFLPTLVCTLHHFFFSRSSNFRRKKMWNLCCQWNKIWSVDFYEKVDG